MKKKKVIDPLQTISTKRTKVYIRLMIKRGKDGGCIGPTNLRIGPWREQPLFRSQSKRMREGGGGEHNIPKWVIVEVWKLTPDKAILKKSWGKTGDKKSKRALWSPSSHPNRGHLEVMNQSHLLEIAFERKCEIRPSLTKDKMKRYRNTSYNEQFSIQRSFQKFRVSS